MALEAKCEEKQSIHPKETHKQLHDKLYVIIPCFYQQQVTQFFLREFEQLTLPIQVELALPVQQILVCVQILHTHWMTAVVPEIPQKVLL